MKFTLETRYIKPTRVVCDWERYHNGVIALSIHDAKDGTPICHASVNPPGHVSDGEIAIKTWFENEGMEAALIAGGIIEKKPLRHIFTPHVDIPVYALTETALKDIKRSER